MTLTHIETKQDYIDYCHAFNMTFTHYGISVMTQKQDAEAYFSHRPCEICHRHLGGDRYDMIAIDKENDKLEFSVCPDCLYLNEYGQLYDMTMLSIEETN